MFKSVFAAAVMVTAMSMSTAASGLVDMPTKFNSGLIDDRPGITDGEVKDLADVNTEEEPKTVTSMNGPLKSNKMVAKGICTPADKGDVVGQCGPCGVESICGSNGGEGCRRKVDVHSRCTVAIDHSSPCGLCKMKNGQKGFGSKMLRAQALARGVANREYQGDLFRRNYDGSWVGPRMNIWEWSKDH